MQLIGCLFCWIFAIICVKMAIDNLDIEDMNFDNLSDGRVVEAKVVGTLNYYGWRRVVEIIDDDGNRALGMDHISAERNFHPEHYSLPQRGSFEKVYIWPSAGSDTHVIDGAPILYEFRFCNEGCYQWHRERGKLECFCFGVAGIILLVLGLLFLLSGNH